MINRIPSGAIPGVNILPFLSAKFFTNNGLREVRAIVWHFAEGGGTDTWLTHPTGDNSSHFVLKDTGALRQMVEFTDASHSLHIDMSGTVGDYGIFSLAAAKKALGAGIADPNAYIIAIEVEGFAKEGPNADQARAIPLIARYLERLFPKAVHLGHRDFQNYKPCPGPTLFRGLLPHADRLDNSQETPVQRTFNIGPEARSGTFTVVGDDHLYLNLKTNTLHEIANGDVKRAFGPVTLTDGGITGPDDPRTVVFIIGTEAAAMLVADGKFTADAYTRADIDNAVAAATAPLKASLAAENAEDAAAATKLEAIADDLRT